MALPIVKLLLSARGKCHAREAESKKSDGDIALYIDLRTIGSSGGLYADPSQPLALRATHLLVDLVEELHNQVRDLVENTATFDDVLDALIPALDDLGTAASELRVVGATESSMTIRRADDTGTSGQIAAGLAGTVPSIRLSVDKRRRRSKEVTESTRSTGPEVLTVQFGQLGRALASLLRAMTGRELWILLDEWSSIPRDLQPYLADLLRRSFFPVAGIVVKIGALERQSQFIERGAGSDYIGFDLGADTAASVDLDDFLVFRADRSHKISPKAQDLLDKIVRDCVRRGESRAVNDGTDTVSRRLLDGSRSLDRLRSGSVIQLPAGAAR